MILVAVRQTQYIQYIMADNISDKLMLSENINTTLIQILGWVLYNYS